MRAYKVELTRQLIADPGRYERLLRPAVGPIRARAVVDSLLEACARLATAPHRGSDQGDIRRGLRTLPVLKRGTLAFLVDDARSLVVVVAWMWRGADLARALVRYRQERE